MLIPCDSRLKIGAARVRFRDFIHICAHDAQEMPIMPFLAMKKGPIFLTSVSGKDG